MGAFSVGNALSWSSPALPMLEDPITTPLEEPITTEDKMWIGSLLAVGALIGALPTG